MSIEKADRRVMRAEVSLQWMKEVKGQKGNGIRKWFPPSTKVCFRKERRNKEIDTSMFLNVIFLPDCKLRVFTKYFVANRFSVRSSWCHPCISGKEKADLEKSTFHELVHVLYKSKDLDCGIELKCVLQSCFCSVHNLALFPGSGSLISLCHLVFYC